MLVNQFICEKNMSGLEDRQKGLENRFAHEEELKFKVISRRRKLLGLWAAEKMSLDKDATEKYAAEIVSYGIDDSTPGAVVKKVIADAKKHGIILSETEVRTKNSEFEAIASRQIIEEKR